MRFLKRMAKIALELFPIPNSNLSSKACKFQFWVRGTQVGGLDYLVRCLPSRPNHLRNIEIKQLCGQNNLVLALNSPTPLAIILLLKT